MISELLDSSSVHTSWRRKYSVEYGQGVVQKGLSSRMSLCSIMCNRHLLERFLWSSRPEASNERRIYEKSLIVASDTNHWNFFTWRTTSEKIPILSNASARQMSDSSSVPVRWNLTLSTNAITGADSLVYLNCPGLCLPSYFCYCTCTARLPWCGWE